MTPDSSGSPDRLVIYPSRRKLSLVLLGSIAFVAIGIWIGTPEIARRVAIWEVVIASYVGVPFFAACGLYAAYRLASHRPAVEIDWTGIPDAASALGVGRLSCDEVDHVVLYKYSGQSMLGIVPKPRHLPEPPTLCTEVSDQGVVALVAVALSIAGLFHWRGGFQRVAESILFGGLAVAAWLLQTGV